MLPIRIKACSESDLRMLGNLARNIQRVLPVTQADIDAAAALGKGWVVWKVVEVNDPIAFSTTNYTISAIAEMISSDVGTISIFISKIYFKLNKRIFYGSSDSIQTRQCRRT